MKKLLLTLVLLVAVAALASGCGDSTETATQSADMSVPDPCALFTRADAESVLGVPTPQSQSSELEGARSCSYTSTDASPRMASVKIVKPCSMADYMNYAESPMAEPVQGIGMHASWNKSELLVHSMSGDTCVYASSSGSTDAADNAAALEQAKKIAMMVLGKLDSKQ